MSNGFSIENTTVTTAVNETNFQNNQKSILSGSGIINTNYSTVYIINTGLSYIITLPNCNYTGKVINIIVTSNELSSSSNITMNYVDGWGNNQFYIFGTLGDSFSCTSTTLGWHIVANIFTDLPVVTTSSFTRTMSDGILIGTVSSSLTIINLSNKTT